MTTFGLIRHGMTDWNKTGRLQGQHDVALNEEGRWQAKALALRLAREKKWDAIVSSDLSRAVETAQIIAEYTGLGPVRLESRLRERTHGRLEGTTLEERIARWGPNWNELDHGVESDEQMFARGYACLRELSEQYPGQNVLVVTHGAFIVVMLKNLLKQMPEGWLQNASLSIIRQQGDGWECDLYNCTEHLSTDRPE